MKAVPTLIIFLAFVLVSLCQIPPTEGCRKNLDIFFAIGGSRILLGNDVKSIQTGLSGMIDSFHIAQRQNRMGFGVYSKKDTFTVPLSDKPEYLKKQIGNIAHFKASLSTHSGLQNLIEELDNFGHKGTPKVGVVIANGFSDDRHATTLLTRLAKEIGINMFSVGVGPTDKEELREITSNTNQVVNVDSFEELPSKLSELVQLVCTSID